MRGASVLIPLPAFLALLTAGAHFWRGGQPGLAATSGLLALLAWTRSAWVRLLLLLALPPLAAHWIWTTAQLVQLRLMLGEPWHRLAAILLGVALFTVLGALPLLRESARRRYHRDEPTGLTQLGALLLCLALLLPVWIMHPSLFVLERFFPHWGLLQPALACLWAALVAGWLNGKKASAVRMRLWRLFSLVFFAQLVLGLTVESRFLLSGNLHLPVPGLIAAAPVYRGGGWFMLALFGASTLLVGAAWCSHLCYFGVWDATAAKSASRRPAPPWLAHLRLGMLVLTILAALTLRFVGAPTAAAVGCGLLLGLALVPCALFVSRKAGYAAYCRGICPLGQLAKWLGGLSPWRVRRTGTCRRCMACARVCRQDAMGNPAANSGPDANCNLCRDCLTVCPQKALTITCYGFAQTQTWAGPALTALLAALHAAFLAMARI